MELNARVGGKTANSFVTLARADEIIAAGPYPTTAWDAATDAKKIFCLILAARFMRSRYSYKGWPVHLNQSLPFPRYYTELPDQPHGIFAPSYRVYEWTSLNILGLTTDEIAAADVIPEEIEMAQCYIAYGVIFRGLVGVTDPARGPLGKKPQVKELNLFDGGLKIVTSDRPLSVTDNSMIERVIRSEHFHIILLLEDWISGASMGPGLRSYALLPETL